MGLALFIWWELKVKEPIVNLRILKNRNLSIASTLTFISGVGIYSSVLLTPLFAQKFLNFPPLQTGLLLLPGACVAIIGLMVTGRLLQRGISPLYMILSGMGMFIFFSWQISHLNGAAGPSDITYPLIWRALGLAIITVPLTTLAVSGLSPQQIPQGSALNNMMRQLGGSFGIALVNTYLAQRLAVHRSDLVSVLRIDNRMLMDRLNGYSRYLLSKGSSIFEGSKKGLGLLDQTVVRQSGILSYLDAYLLVGVIFCLALPLLLFAKKRKANQPPVVVSDH
jgi:DHA2 family multidrug resistance protein